ncbi:LysR family transcriptional regulator [Novosphingobium sp. FKTRR1]|uniref:LysR family transcriptional regulator n=1 Tax=Novosphingobium sp. FKTRR1 TaxID=2879118 RepID=UPI001CF0B2E8|nr:LysR family transcriptional regulator [Novosphingobium sp. FKTRR1]
MLDPDYEVFVGIVAAGSISAAARALHLSPASLSKRLARLEERLGVRLLNRTTRRMTLTSEGISFHADLQAILHAIEAAEQSITGRQEAIGGPLRITAPTSFGRMHLAPCLADFLTLYPQIELDIELSDGFVDLLEGRFDLALRITRKIGNGLCAHRLADNRRVLCAAPAYLAQAGTPLSLSALRRHRLLAAEGQLPWPLLGPDGAVSLNGQSAVRTNSSEVVRELALGGAGIALRSLWDVAPALASGDLVRVLPDWQGSADVGIFLVHAPTPRLAANTRAFIGFCQQRFADGAPWEASER